MLGVEDDVDDILSELMLINGEEENRHQNGLPPGFRFHPTDEELITFYLASKVFNGTFCGVDIAEVDLNRCEPWELPDVAKMGEREWYFFSLRDRKYPTGLRTNRATRAGYWKATGKDREVYSASTGALLGLKKTLVFYRGRAPRGEKTKWVMHEYRLDGDFSYRHTSKEEWVICRIFHKNREQKNGFIQGHTYLLEEASAVASFPIIISNTSTSSLPPLLETPTQQKPFLVDHHPHESPDLKYLLNTTISHPNQLLQTNVVFPPSFSSTINNISSLTTSPSPSMLLKSLLSSPNQDFTVPKHCKSEANNNLSHFQVPPPDDANNLNYWMENNQNPHQSPLHFQMGGCNFQGSSTTAGHSATASTVHDMSLPVGSQMMLDPSYQNLC